ncbi:peptide-methionine (R)-S-oxide reductase MsrB [Candidatus Woesearchaeota archaeon]|nr:peptide-methionine (R)-S-oxide reductase MsrB [Candidatus Woesearchaeota archaeon]
MRIRLKMEKTESGWKKKLSPEQYRVLREKGTEAPFSGKYDALFDSGSYKCAACGSVLFNSDTKYDSGCGWPAFFAANAGSIKTQDDNSFGMRRIEVMCKRCGSHLGHVFDDGPRDKGGKRYCINSLALSFEKS